jgi:ComF family protein
MVDVLAQLTKLRGAALDVLFPRYCVGCGKEGSFICASCLQSLPRLEPPICPKCGLPQRDGKLCANCRGWEADIDAIRSPFRFDGVIRSAIHQLKYRNLRAIAPLLALLMSEYLASCDLNADIVIPVPLHHRRMRERGYNQSALLAKELAKMTGIPLDETSLVREKYILPQARTNSVEERRANVRGAFIYRGDNVKGKNVLLVDDVATSGATMNSAASVIKSAGAAAVWGLALAREI